MQRKSMYVATWHFATIDNVTYLEFVPRYPDDNLTNNPCISMWLSPGPCTD